MKIYCSCCDKVQSVRIDNCRDAKTNEPFQDIVCAECDLVIASGTDIAQPEQEPVDCERCNRLEDALKRANSLAEHFERAWYLLGDEIERLTAQPEQEPVAWCAQSELDWLNSDKRGASAYVKTTLSKRRDGLAQTALYTAPPQRERQQRTYTLRKWQGLTADELNMIGDRMRTWNSHSLADVYVAIEAKLKEKNT